MELSPPTTASSSGATAISSLARVVRETGTIINGHKRVAAAQLAGLERHPVEVVSVTDDQACDLFAIAHREQASQKQADNQPSDTEQDTEASS